MCIRPVMPPAMNAIRIRPEAVQAPCSPTASCNVCMSRCVRNHVPARRLPTHHMIHFSVRARSSPASSRTPRPGADARDLGNYEQPLDPQLAQCCSQWDRDAGRRRDAKADRNSTVGVGLAPRQKHTCIAPRPARPDRRLVLAEVKSCKQKAVTMTVDRPRCLRRHAAATVDPRVAPENAAVLARPP